MRQKLVETEAHLAQALEELKRLERDREQQPVQNGEFKVFSLRYLQVARAAEIIESMVDPGATRVAVDERTNSLVVFGAPDSMSVVEALLARLDVLGPDGGGEESSHGAAAESHSGAPRMLMVRVVWLADGLSENEGRRPEGVLPQGVVESLVKLGLDDPRIVTQTVNALAASSDVPMEFKAGVPVVLHGEHMHLQCLGHLRPTRGRQVEMELNISVPNCGVDVSGSLAAPLGHYTVLGTGNAIKPSSRRAMLEALRRQQEEERRMMEQSERQREQDEESSARREDRTRRDALLSQLEAAANADEGNDNSPFAFVVQVIEGQSFAAGESNGESDATAK
jgi:hypothetical protein